MQFPVGRRNKPGGGVFIQFLHWEINTITRDGLFQETTGESGKTKYHNENGIDARSIEIEIVEADEE